MFFLTKLIVYSLKGVCPIFFLLFLYFCTKLFRVLYWSIIFLLLKFNFTKTKICFGWWEVKGMMGGSSILQIL